MTSVLRVTWTVVTSRAPQILRYCGRCKRQAPFACSDKFRVNAQKKRIDAWLIYRCTVCGRRWKCPIIERCPRAMIEPADLAGMMANRASLVRRYARDRRFLQAHGAPLAARDETTLERVSVGPRPPAPGEVVITIAAPDTSEIRLDRLIAKGLGLSRKDVCRLSDSGALALCSEVRDALKRSVRDQQVVRFRLAALAAMPDLRAAILRGAVDRDCPATESAAGRSQRVSPVHLPRQEGR